MTFELWSQEDTIVFIVGQGGTGGALAPKGGYRARYRRATDDDDDDDDKKSDDAKSQEDDVPLDNAAATQDDVSDVRQVLKRSDGGKKGDVIN